MSTSSISVRSIHRLLVRDHRVSIRHGVVSAAPNQSVSPGIPLSSYTPADARSLIDTSPIKSDAASSSSISAVCSFRGTRHHV